MRVNLVHIIIQFDFKRLWSEKNGRGGVGYASLRVRAVTSRGGLLISEIPHG